MFFHNLLNYDAHFIMQELHNIPEIEGIEVTAKTLEKFFNFKVKIFEFNFKLDFKDNLYPRLDEPLHFWHSEHSEQKIAVHVPNMLLFHVRKNISLFSVLYHSSLCSGLF